MEPLWLIDEFIFSHPFTCLIAGPSQSGKTSLIKEILMFDKLIIEPNIHTIIYCYQVWQPIYDEIKKFNSNIEFHEGIYNIENFDQSNNSLLILDDLMKECENDQSILNLFTVDSHHKNISVFLLTQNIFSKGKYTRTISLNSSYIIIFKNPRDKSQVFTLARQMFPDKMNFFMEAFNDAVTNRAHSYLFVDLKQKTPERNRIQTGIIPGNLRIFYTAK